MGALCAGGQASVLGAYDDLRLRHPLVDGQRVTWETLDARLRSELARAAGAVRVLTGSDAAASPTTRGQINAFLDAFPDGRHDVYDVLSASAIADAHLGTHGVRVVPRFRFDRADSVVSFDADFLGTWISPVEFAGQYTRSRPGWHVQYESLMTVTGAQADQRVSLSPWDVSESITALLRLLARHSGEAQRGPAAQSRANLPAERMAAVAEWLWRARGRALVVCGSSDPETQAHVNHINELLGAYGTTIDLARPSRQRLGDDKCIEQLMAELQDGAVGALVLCGVNPVHDLPEGVAWRRLLRDVPVVVSVAERLDETSTLARYVCPSPHFLESWGDYEPVAGVLCLRQPATVASGNTRSLDASLAAWSGSVRPAQEIVKRRWREEVYDPLFDGDSFQVFWDRSLREGWLERPATAAETPQYNGGGKTTATNRDARWPGELLLVGYPSVGMLDGRQSFNPWLLELPDPVTKVTWESCASLSPATARSLGLMQGDVIRIEPANAQGAQPNGGASDPAIELPVILQPGQHDDVVGVPVGFGQQASARFADVASRWLGKIEAGSGGNLIGVNVAPLLARASEGRTVGPSAVTVTAAGRRIRVASTQGQGQLFSTGGDRWGRGGVETILRAVAAAPASGTGEDGETAYLQGASQNDRSLWRADHRYEGPRWGMLIDLDACTGCSACVVACQVENNTPVVGRGEVLRRREMHWLRIDRYYLDESPNPSLVHQPMTCHHCGNAPCETVCPVLATTHSSDGLNQQIYSRCIGTRYCLNNCPLRVRRFNWFDHVSTEEIPNLSLNPDVTVRTRGVAEKCTFCVQRIQEARLEARRQGRKIGDGDVVPACAQTCPSNAIILGDLNDPASRVRQFASGARAYSLFDELNLEPAIRYLALRRRKKPDELPE